MEKSPCKQVVKYIKAAITQVLPKCSSGGTKINLGQCGQGQSDAPPPTPMQSKPRSSQSGCPGPFQQEGLDDVRSPLSPAHAPLGAARDCWPEVDVWTGLARVARGPPEAAPNGMPDCSQKAHSACVELPVTRDSHGYPLEICKIYTGKGAAFKIKVLFRIINSYMEWWP